jgi:sulfite exporter TauE/SafE
MRETLLISATFLLMDARSILPAGSYLPWLGILCGIAISAVGCYRLLRSFSASVRGRPHSSAIPHTHHFSPTLFAGRPRPDAANSSRWLTFAIPIGTALFGVAVALTSLLIADHSILERPKDRLGPLVFVIGLGLILGMRHSTDADHVVAISTIVSKQRSIRSAALIGCVWGLGHTITIFLVGSLIILFNVEIPPRLGLSMEFSVAVMLVLLGILNLTGVMQKIAARFTPSGFVSAPSLVESSFTESTNRQPEDSSNRLGLFQWLRPLVIGLVHGLAGSAAVALLVLSTIHSPVWATFYLIVFGAGTMIGMMIMTAAIVMPLAFAGNRFNTVSKYLGVISGLVSLCFGCFLIYQLGFLGGLFSSHPQWTPQ